MEATDPKTHKKLGRQVKPFDKKKWSESALFITQLFFRTLIDQCNSQF